jgi:hypothetical protein
MQILNKITEKSREKNWWIRLPLVLFYFYLLIKHLQNPEYVSIIGYLNLGIHEAGHPLFGYFGEFMGVAGGTILQLIIPLGSILMFYKQKDYFGISFSFAWISTNLYYISAYMGDAVRMVLPRVSLPGSGTPIHDWNYLFSELGILSYHHQIASGVRFLGTLTMISAILWGLIVLWYMFQKTEQIQH